MAPLVSASEEAHKDYANNVKNLNALYPDLNLQIDEQTGLLDANSQAQLENIDILKRKELYEAQEEEYTAILNAQNEAIQSVQEAEVELLRVRTEREAIEAQGGSAVLGEMAQLYQEEQRLNEEILRGNTIIEECDAKLQELNVTMTATGEGLDSAALSQADMNSVASDAVTTIAQLREEYDTARETARASIDSQIGAFDELKASSGTTANSIIKNMESQLDGLTKYDQNLQKLVDMGYPDEILQQFSDFSVGSMGYVAALANATPEEMQKIVETFNAVDGIKEKVGNVTGGIKEDTSGKIQDITKEVESACDGIPPDVREAAEEVQAYIDSLRGKTVYVDVITNYLNKSSSAPSAQQKYSSKPSLQSVAESAAIPVAANLPFLASGAVIPPNAPFAAILGDQRHGTNIEAPLATIQEAVANVLGDTQPAMVAGFEAVVDRLEVLAATIENIEIGDTTLGAAAARYQRRQTLVTGVKE